MTKAGALLLMGWLAASMSASATAEVSKPKRKAGLWEIKVLNPDLPKPQTMQVCTDEKTDDVMAGFGADTGKKTCSKESFRREGAKFIAESVCTVGGSTVTSRSEVTGDFSKAYRVETRTTYSPPMMGMTQSSSTLEASFVGPCKPGQKPGDVIPFDAPPGMPTFNIQDALKMFKK